jgi:hypothetical protein
MDDPNTDPQQAGLYRPDLDHLERDVLEKLAAGVDENDVVLEVCERTGWTWPAASEFLETLKFERVGELARRRFPLAVVISATVFLVGAGILAACFFALHDVAVAAWHLRRVEDIPDLIPAVLVQAQTLQLAVLGAGMVAGGTIGLARASSDLGSGR